MGTLQGCASDAQSQIGRGAEPGTLSAESAVVVIARLDEAYYALLEHHLSCGHRTPPVPPPHIYLPAVVAANPGICRIHHLDRLDHSLIFYIIQHSCGGLTNNQRKILESAEVPRGWLLGGL